MSNELTDIHVLRGPEAVQALDIYAEQLESRGGDGLTKMQTDFLIRTARLLSQIISKNEGNSPSQQETDSIPWEE